MEPSRRQRNAKLDSQRAASNAELKLWRRLESQSRWIQLAQSQHRLTRWMAPKLGGQSAKTQFGRLEPWRRRSKYAKHAEPKPSLRRLEPKPQSAEPQLWRF